MKKAASMEILPVITEDYVVVQDTAPLSEVIGKLRQFEKHSVLVFHQDQYGGLIEKKKLLRSRLDVTEAGVKKFIQKTPVLSEHADVIETAYLLFQSNADFLPVERGKKIAGVVKAVDIAGAALALPELAKLKVADVKVLRPTALAKDDPLISAVTIMFREHVDEVPIVDAGKFYGIISYKDFVRKYLNWSPHRNFSAKFNKMASSRSAEADMPRLSSLPVSSFSTNENLLTVSVQQSLKEAVRCMQVNGVSDLIIMEGGKFMGLLTVKNILRSIASVKVPKNFNIRFIGLNQAELEPYQKYNVQKIASNEAFKLQREIHNAFSLVIHLKEYEKAGKKEGKQHKYAVHLRVEYPGRIITVAQDDWDIETALRKTFENAKNNLKKKFKGDSSRKKYYSP